MRASRNHLLPLASLALVLATAGDAAAQRAPAAPAAPAAAPAAEAKPKEDSAIETAAKTRFAEGVKLYGAKKYEQARAAFLQAYLLKKQPPTQLALAQASLRSGHQLEALRLFEQYLSENAAPPPKVRARIDASMAEARAALAQVTITAPPGAEIFVDDKSVGKTPEVTAVDLAPGTHSVKVELGEDSTSQSVALGAGGSIAVVLEAKQKAKGVPPPAKLKAPTPVTASESVETSSIFSPPQTKWPMYLAGAVGLIGLGSAVIFGSLSINSNKGAQVARDGLSRAGQPPEVCLRSTDGTPYRDVCKSILENVENARGQQGAFTVSLIVGGSGIGLAALWYLFAPKETSVAPTVGKDGAGATFTTTF